MAVTNEQAHEAASSSRNVVNCACADVAAWLAAAARELHHSLVPPIDMVFQAYKDDLRSECYVVVYFLLPTTTMPTDAISHL